jgi:hypothetical protein
MLYPTCRVILCFDDAGNNVLCGKPTLDGSPYCAEHENQSDVMEPWDDEEFSDNEFVDEGPSEDRRKP